MYVSFFLGSSIDCCVEKFLPKDRIVFGQTLDYQEEYKNLKFLGVKISEVSTNCSRIKQ